MLASALQHPATDQLEIATTSSTFPRNAQQYLACFPEFLAAFGGVDPARQGRGLGRELPTSCLRVIDESHLPAYLETPNPRTIPLCERMGFEVTGAARARGCPPVTFMLRAAR